MKDPTKEEFKALFVSCLPDMKILDEDDLIYFAERIYVKPYTKSALTEAGKVLIKDARKKINWSNKSMAYPEYYPDPK